MKIAIVGGLGYLGNAVWSRLGDFLIDNRHSDFGVDIVDCNLYGKWAEDEINKIVGVENCLVENIVKIKPEYWNQWDKIIICSDIDNQEFYTWPLAGYRKKYIKALKRIFLSGADVYYVYTDTSPDRNNFISEVIKNAGETWRRECPDKYWHKECPVLYGTARAFRSDTVVNQAVLSFAVAKEYVLEQDPFKVVEFANVNEFAREVVDWALGSEKPHNALKSKLPLMMLCNIIQWMFGTEYKLAIAAEVAKSLDVGKEMIGFIDKDGLTLFIEEIKRGMELGPAEDLLKEVYDNAYHVRAMVAGMRYQKFLK